MMMDDEWWIIYFQGIQKKRHWCKIFTSIFLMCCSSCALHSPRSGFALPQDSTRWNGHIEYIETTPMESTCAYAVEAARFWPGTIVVGPGPCGLRPGCRTVCMCVRWAGRCIGDIMWVGWGLSWEVTFVIIFICHVRVLIILSFGKNG
jgi:hypothetical protein